MHIDLFTDASVARKRAVTSCLLLTTDNYLGCSSQSYENISTSLHGELLAIRDGLLYLSSLNKNADVTLYCDSYAALDMVQSEDTVKFCKVIDEIHSLARRMNVTYQLIQGHQREHNPNKVVDLICNSVLRSI